MSFFHGKARSSSILLIAMILGTALSLLLSQLIWMKSDELRVKAYTEMLLKHAEAVASNISDALYSVEKTSNLDCSNTTIQELKKIVFTYEFVRDAGITKNKSIKCSALWGEVPSSYEFSGSNITTKSQVTLWQKIPSYAIANTFIDVSTKNKVYVVTAKNAFSAYENAKNDIHSKITSTDESVIMHSIGVEQKNPNSLATSSFKTCSKNYDICITSDVHSNIFSMLSLGTILFLVFLGSALGHLIWYSAKQRNKQKNSIESKLKTAIYSNKIDLEYQPIVHLKTGNLRGIEALSRWHDESLGSIQPDVFIRKITEMNLSNKFNQNTISNSISECSTFLKQNPRLYISINVDCEYLIQKDSIFTLTSTARKYDIPTHQIALEILENSTIDIATLNSQINTLKNLGFKILIDDFGTGYSSLAYLSSLKVDLIKIDRSFTQAAGTNSPTESVLLKINDIANTMKTLVIFEGLETTLQKEAILAFNPDALGQGWLFSKSVPLNQIKQNY